MPRLSDAKNERENEARIRHGFANRGKRNRGHRVTAPHSAIAPAAVSGRQSLDSVPILKSERCSERGCIFPAAFLIYDQWGSQPYCRTHHDQIKYQISIEDRTKPLLLDADGKLDGMSTGRLPQPTVFGLRVPFAKVITFGKLIVSGVSPSRAAQESHWTYASGKKLLERSGIAIPYAQRLAERSAQKEARLVAEATAKAERAEQRRAAREARGRLALRMDQERRIQVEQAWRKRAEENRMNTKWGFVIDAFMHGHRELAFKSESSARDRRRVSCILQLNRETCHDRFSVRDLGGLVMIRKIGKR